MAKCDKCGNNYDQSFTVKMQGKTHTFDCFECAISMMAPRCATCGVLVIGHGVQSNNTIYCCAHCAEKKGIDGLVDRV